MNRRSSKLRPEPWLAFFDPRDLIVCTFRYYLGRETINAGHFADQLAVAWNHLPKNERFLIQRDLERAFETDDGARAYNDNYKPLGRDCDRQCWEKVRAQYKQKS